MSNHSVYRLLNMKIIRRKDLLIQSLKELKLEYKVVQPQILVSKEGTTLNFLEMNNEFKVRIRQNDMKAGNMLKEIEEKYSEIYEKHLAELKRKREALEREKILKEVVERSKIEEEQKIVEKEIQTLEKLKKIEEKKRQKLIEKTINEFKDIARIEGYECSIQKKENKRILVLRRI